MSLSRCPPNRQQAKRADGDYRRCTATVVTSQGEAHIGFGIGWHDRRNGLPFWTGESL